MSRRRYISTDISIDTAELAQFGPLPLLLYTWAIPHLDDWGRMSGEPRQFKLLVCPALDVTVSEVEKAMQQITDQGFWQRYQVNGKWYIAFPKESWFKDQSYINTKKRYQDESKFPEPPNAENDRKTPQKAASPSPSPSPSPTDDDDNAQAREEIKNRALETNQEEPKNPVLAMRVEAVEDDSKYLSVSSSLSFANDTNIEEANCPVFTLGSKAIAYAEANFGRMLSPAEIHGISDFCLEFANRDSPDPDSVVIEGLKRCVAHDQRKMSYLRGILIDWLDHGVKDLSHISQRDKEWAAQKVKAINKPKGGNGSAKNLRDTKPRINDSSAYDPSAWARAGYAVST